MSKRMIKAGELRQTWKKASEAGTISWKAFKVASVEIERIVRERMEACCDCEPEEEVVERRPMTQAEWDALPEQQKAMYLMLEEAVFYGDPTEGVKRYVDTHPDGTETIRAVKSTWSDTKYVGTFPKETT